MHQNNDRTALKLRLFYIIIAFVLCLKSVKRNSATTKITPINKFDYSTQKVIILFDKQNTNHIFIYKKKKQIVAIMNGNPITKEEKRKEKKKKENSRRKRKRKRNCCCCLLRR
ncbi:hypothetical protein D0T85_21615 [Bacteroides sp. 519]|nr:hypothetical protein [Bacteroides sp. 519]